ncbi:hypothetical protein AVEN_164130-1 [Araneus ventricosus]|uniref:Uncharacterized protein n=1 Tax=Araneus ventricosus TaxID=182803 RepID=A0A4Y2E5U8_ARAVE|nr:hypothetical protein AVEN_164130-1 [Araneus ventricosus]
MLENSLPPIHNFNSFIPLSGSVFFVKRFEKRAIEEPLAVLKVCLPPNRKCSESAADRVSSPPLNKERSAPPMEGITERICSIQLGTYSNYSARGILGYFSGPGIIAFGRSHLWRD